LLLLNQISGIRAARNKQSGEPDKINQKWIFYLFCPFNQDSFPCSIKGDILE